MDVIELIAVSPAGWINQQVPPETQSRLVPRYITLSERSLLPVPVSAGLGLNTATRPCHIRALTSRSCIRT
jgi:hypothetical protein